MKFKDIKIFGVISILFTLASCGASFNFWHLDHIATQEQPFRSSRLIYSDSNHSPLRLEIICIETDIEAFISLMRHTFHASQDGVIQFQLKVNGIESEDTASLLEGNMRICLSKSCTQYVIQSLQEGKTVTFLVDGFEQLICPDQFKILYEKIQHLK